MHGGVTRARVCGIQQECITVPDHTALMHHGTKPRQVSVHYGTRPCNTDALRYDTRPELAILMHCGTGVSLHQSSWHDASRHGHAGVTQPLPRASRLPSWPTRAAIRSWHAAQALHGSRKISRINQECYATEGIVHRKRVHRKRALQFSYVFCTNIAQYKHYNRRYT